MSKGRATLIIAVLEACVLLVMKAADWQENKKDRPRAANARTTGKHRVVKPGAQEYDYESPEEPVDAAYFLTSGSATDEKIHKKTIRWVRLNKLSARIKGYFPSRRDK